MLGPLISAGSAIFGGLLNRDSAKDATATSERNALRNIELQKEFAQQGIRWKVDDAKAAGIHPLYALGANTTSFSPVSVGATADTSMGSALASAGQDISRAINTTRTQEERDTAFVKTSQDLQLQKTGLENELLSAQIAKLRQTTNPPAPALGPIPEKKDFEERPNLLMGGYKVGTDPWTSNMQDYSDRYGDEGLPSWLIPPMIMWNDLNANSGGYWNKKILGDGPSIVPGSIADKVIKFMDSKFKSRW